MGILLLNDTSATPHIGCQAVSDGHARLLTGTTVDRRYYVTQLKEFWSGDEAGSVRSVLRSPLRAEIERADAVVVNGEGTMHHNNGLQYLAVLGAAQELGCPTFLVNSIFQEIDHFHNVLRGLTDFVVRDGISLEIAHSLGIEARREPDSLLAARWSDRPCVDFENAFVVTDWHPGRQDDVGRALVAFCQKKRSSAFFFPFKHAIQRFVWRHAVESLRSARAVVTARYHGMFIAGLAGVPFVALPSNSHKVDALKRDSGLPLPVCDTPRDFERELKSAVDNVSLFRDFGAYLREEGVPDPLKNLPGKPGQAMAAVAAVAEEEPPDPFVAEFNRNRALWKLSCSHFERARERLSEEVVAEDGAGEKEAPAGWRGIFRRD